MQREEQAHSPTKSDGDSAVLEGLVQGKGLSSFCDGCGDREVRFNGRSKLAPLRKAMVIVRFWKGLVVARDGGTIPPVVARIFSGDSTSPLTREARMLV